MRYRLAAALVALLVLSASAPRVAIVRVAAVTWEDRAIVIEVRVEPKPEHRALLVAAVDGGIVVRQSIEQLEGEQSRKTWRFEWQRLSAGELQIVAAVYDSQGKQLGRDTRTIQVLERR